MAQTHHHICGFFYIDHGTNNWGGQTQRRKYLPQLSLSCHARIVSTVVRATLTQKFVNPSKSLIPELRYTFPLYDGVSVVGFTCTVNKDRVIRGVVKEKHDARQTYNDAVARGETAGLLEQIPDASDVFLTTIGNVPADAEIQVDITYLGELKHDAQIDGPRFTLPTSIAPRYGSYPGELVGKATNASSTDGIKIVVDTEMPTNCAIKSIQSPSHPISVTVGSLSTSADDASPSLHLASASLSLGTAELDKDFVLQVVATNISNPVAILETHPTIPNHRALMTTLVPKFNLPSSRPEIVFICDRSGSMGGGKKIPHLKSALQLFLKSLPLGVKFNICSFGSRYSYLFPDGSKTYDQTSLDAAMRHVESFAADFGGTEIAKPVQETFKRRYKDMDLEVFVLTDGEVWNQQGLFDMVNKNVEDANGSIRLFTLGVGNDVSHALIQGLARAGNGFSQAVLDNEKMDTKVIRMLKGALTPHINDYSLEIKYGKAASELGDDDFEVVEKVLDALNLDISEPEDQDISSTTPPPESKPTISLFDPSADPDAETSEKTGRYPHVPPVPAPKLLQTPFHIPPLFPFNRTSIYLLLSPGTTQRLPSAVVLRGTSVHGPLELEIPVMALIIPDKTIHQLAARAAVKELEEGRGWITQAKDKSGALLKEKYEGRFPDMVEREAVRLGLEFQVAGKWCSFVAVEDNDQSEKKSKANPIEIARQVEEDAVTTKLQAVSPGSSKDVIATVAVISFLRKKLPLEKDAWEMLVEKATAWLEGELGDFPTAMAEAVDELFE
ncbi:putative von willebrand domain containing protein [Phaeoacremonium minimum UCRPA7]|uniref:Putative von willebrand domain containing protein n=1 Tax=Phaeoacremonium minimum (strain UCR-PA7) TaxID=1286976 RepID=R8BFY4_PHAM7|nr:putative von willebrand domain containing protein [Phaeoacremonium minimum UCRPA7]EON98208.1 putative von willebrand domain containing protein [Phaeoacremonium minimum UCRPA7]